MDSKLYYLHIVKPTVAEYANDHLNRRLGLLAALPVYHFPEHAYSDQFDDTQQVSRAVESYRNQQRSMMWFAALENFANAFKHGMRRNGYCLEDSWTAPPSFAGTFALGKSVMGDTTGGVLLKTAPESVRLVRLSDVLQKAMDAYERDFPYLTTD